MLAILLKILSVLGIILLALLGLLLCVLLLILFMPVVYRVSAVKDAQHLLVNGKVRWLFGLVRVKVLYPDPGAVIVRFLWFTLYDSKKSVTKKVRPERKEREKTEPSGEMAESTTSNLETKEEAEQGMEQNLEKNGDTPPVSEKPEEERPTLKEKLFAKYEKIKYTLKKIYDKIKHVLENITFYKEVLQDAETQGLVSHGLRRLGKIFRSIRPRRLKTNVIFGTGSPDTTGYAFGIYGMFMPKLGKQVVITPDFTQKILEGQFDAKGHITVFTLLRHIIAVLFDKRLWLLKKKMDAHQRKMKQET